MWDDERKHVERRLIDFIPYWCRPSAGTFLRSENEQGATISMSVQGCGMLIIRADGVGPGNDAFCSIIEEPNV